MRAPIGGRHIGQNDVPVPARIVSYDYDQAWRLLGTRQLDGANPPDERHSTASASNRATCWPTHRCSPHPEPT